MSDASAPETVVDTAVEGHEAGLQPALGVGAGFRLQRRQVLDGLSETRGERALGPLGRLCQDAKCLALAALLHVGEVVERDEPCAVEALGGLIQQLQVSAPGQ